MTADAPEADAAEDSSTPATTQEETEKEAAAETTLNAIQAAEETESSAEEQPKKKKKKKKKKEGVPADGTGQTQHASSSFSHTQESSAQSDQRPQKPLTSAEIKEQRKLLLI